MSFNDIFTYSRCMYIVLTNASGFSHIAGHGFQRDVLRYSL